MNRKILSLGFLSSFAFSALAAGNYKNDAQMTFHHESMQILNKSDTEMRSLGNGKNVDANFAQIMTMHDKNGIDMAKIYLKYGENPRLIALAKSIIASQSKEIGVLQAQLKIEQPDALRLTPSEVSTRKPSFHDETHSQPEAPSE